MKIRKAKSIHDIEKQKFHFIPLKNEEWQRHLGQIEKSKSILIMGDSGDGKTAYSLQMARAFCQTEKVIYNTVEEGTSATFLRNLRLNKMKLVANNFQFVSEKIDDFLIRLRRKRQPKIAFIDSIQYAFEGKRKEYYHEMIKEFNKTLFVGISHYEKGAPVGAVAKQFYWDCQNRILVQDWKAHLQKTRCGGDELEPFVINEEKAAQRELKLLKNG